MPDSNDDPTGARRDRALLLWEEGYKHQMLGDVDGAITMYRRSIEVLPTAEAHTFLGWAYSFLDRIDDAVSECERAIEIDPDFGNPYNDIGVYLIQREQLDEAIPWLEKAKQAVRYEPRHYPFLNLGRIYAAKGQLHRAIQEFEGALEHAPHDRMARKAIDELKMTMN